MSALSANQEFKIKELIADGNKIAAIALYREMTSVGLKEAKDAVEAMLLGTPVNFPVSSQESKPDPFLENRIRRLLAERKKIEAIKIYREAHHCGLKEAKDAVDLIQAEMRREDYHRMSSTPAISDDPFTEDTFEKRRRQVMFIVVLLVAVSGLALFFFLRGGF